VFDISGILGHNVTFFHPTCASYAKKREFLPSTEAENAKIWKPILNGKMLCCFGADDDAAVVGNLGPSADGDLQILLRLMLMLYIVACGCIFPDMYCTRAELWTCHGFAPQQPPQSAEKDFVTVLLCHSNVLSDLQDSHVCYSGSCPACASQLCSTQTSTPIHIPG
jgi:hypothetical protein